MALFRLLAFIYGLGTYAVFFATFLYGLGFFGNFAVPKTIDSGPRLPLGTALLVNVSLLALFSVQHSVMARPAFKKIWTKVIPVAVERSTYVLVSSLALIALFRYWQPMGGVIWRVEGTLGKALLYGLYALGVLIILISTFAIHHGDMFGLRQVYLHLREREYTPIPFRVPGPYKVVRHPLYLGWLLFFWSTPSMTVAHLLCALGMTAYILVAIQFEERDLLSYFGDDYRRYKARVPSLLPFWKR